MSRLDERGEPPASPRRPPSLRPEEDDEEDPEVVIQPRGRALSVSGQPLVAGGYEGMRCAGCDRAFGPRETRTKITPGGVGMVHNHRPCLLLAREAMARMAEAEAPGGASSSGSVPAAHQSSDGAEGPVCMPCDPQPTILRAGSSVRSGSDQRRQQLKNRTGPARRERVDLCLHNSIQIAI